MKSYYVVFSFILCLSGCRSPGQNTGSDIGTHPGIAKEMSETNLFRAQLMQRQENYQSAIIEYRKILDSSVCELEIQEARLGIAQCLVKLKKFASAISGLNPLPLPPKSDLDSQILATTGEAMLHLRQYEEAESVLEIALSNTEIFASSIASIKKLDSINPGNNSNKMNYTTLFISSCSLNLLQTMDSTPSWIAPCSGNLGYAYLKNDKPIPALLLYEKAAELYEKQGDMPASLKARKMAVNIETIIKQYRTQ